jgi:hypothetical protein
MQVEGPINYKDVDTSIANLQTDPCKYVSLKVGIAVVETGIFMLIKHELLDFLFPFIYLFFLISNGAYV